MIRPFSGVYLIAFREDIHQYLFDTLRIAFYILMPKVLDVLYLKFVVCFDLRLHHNDQVLQELTHIELILRKN